VLRTAISELRTALDDDRPQPRFIQTVSRRGYRFIANATDSLQRRSTACCRRPIAWRIILHRAREPYAAFTLLG